MYSYTCRVVFATVSRFLRVRVCGCRCVCVLVCFQKRGGPPGTPERCQASQPNTVPTSPFDDLCLYLKKKKKNPKPFFAYVDLFCLHICSTLTYSVELKDLIPLQHL